MWSGTLIEVWSSIPVWIARSAWRPWWPACTKLVSILKNPIYSLPICMPIILVWWRNSSRIQVRYISAGRKKNLWNPGKDLRPWSRTPGKMVSRKMNCDPPWINIPLPNTVRIGFLKWRYWMTAIPFMSATTTSNVSQPRAIPWDISVCTSRVKKSWLPAIIFSLTSLPTFNAGRTPKIHWSTI